MVWFTQTAAKAVPANSVSSWAGRCGARQRDLLPHSSAHMEFQRRITDRRLLGACRGGFSLYLDGRKNLVAIPRPQHFRTWFGGPSRANQGEWRLPPLSGPRERAVA